MGIPKVAATPLPTPLPLFERATRSALVMLVVRRLESGRWVRAPKTFTPAELPDRDAVRARFGGGKYEVIGRDAHRIVARTTFSIEGATLPLEEPTPRAAREERGERAFASDIGERQALVFAFFDQGLSCVAVTQRTGIEDDVVRDIYLRWLTPDGGLRPTTLEEVECCKRQRALERRDQLRQEWS